MQLVVEHSKGRVLKKPTNSLRTYKAPFETSSSSSRLKGEGMLELNKMIAIEAELDVLMVKMSTQERRSHSVNAVGIEEEDEKKCNNNEGLAHEGPY